MTTIKQAIMNDGQLLQRLALYDDKTLSLLRRAHEKAKAEQDSLEKHEQEELGNNRVPVLPSSGSPQKPLQDLEIDWSDDEFPPLGPNNEDGEEDSEEESDSSSVNSGYSGTAAKQLSTVVEGEEEKNLPNLETRGACSTNTNGNVSTLHSIGMRKKQASSKQQKRQAQIVKQHLSNIMRISLPLPPEENSSTLDPSGQVPRQLCIPSSLLVKADLQLASLVQKVYTLMDLSQKLQEKRGYVVVLLLQSGRFAGGVFEQGKCVVHRSLQQYTVRKGQGKAQSSQDQKRRPKSVGSQLRRSGEQALKEDVRETLEQWLDYIKDAILLFVSCPKTSRATLFGTNEETGTISAASAGNVVLLSKDDKRLRKVPFDFGRPTFESVNVVHEALMDIEVRTSPTNVEVTESTQESNQVTESRPSTKTHVREERPKDEKQVSIDSPLAPLHEACRDGNLSILLDLLKNTEPGSQDINQPAGYDLMTPLHFAAASTLNVDPVTAAACVSALLIQAHADPSIMDARGRPAYFLASHDKVREAFRTARAILGEECCDWDGAAKVASPLREEDFAARKEKEADKKRRKKARQKEKKEKEQAQAGQLEERRIAEEEKQRQAEEARRVRDGLSPKITGANVCDFCQKSCKGKKRNQMFERLEYKYCSTDCVNSHKRELMAAAAMARFSG
jgi:hypothetical protein